MRAATGKSDARAMAKAESKSKTPAGSLRYGREGSLLREWGYLAAWVE